MLAASEAGSGAVLAALSKAWKPKDGSIVVASPIASQYFADLPLRVVPDSIDEFDLRELLATTAPEVVITGASAGKSIEKRVLNAAHLAAIRVVAFVDHYWNLWQRFADPEVATPWQYLPDRIYVPAAACAARLREMGCPLSEVHVYEHPLLKMGKCERSQSEGKAFRCNLGIAENALVILFISEYLFPPDDRWQWDQPNAMDYSELLTLLLNISTRKDLKRPIVILVRPHPSEPQDRWDELCESVQSANWRNVGQAAKNNLIGCADVVVGLNSNFLLEAAANGLPCYSYHFSSTNMESWLSSIRTEIVELGTEFEMQTLFERMCETNAWCMNDRNVNLP